MMTEALGGFQTAVAWQGHVERTDLDILATAAPSSRLESVKQSQKIVQAARQRLAMIRKRQRYQAASTQPAVDLTKEQHAPRFAFRIGGCKRHGRIPIGQMQSL